MADIRHVVVLMLENRSFDSLLGALSPMPPHFNGLNGREYNVYEGQRYAVTSPVVGSAPFSIPTPDPGESYADITEQIFSSPDPEKISPPAMSGFVANYAAQKSTSGPLNPQAVMHHYTEAQVPVLHQLAKAFGVSDQWFASAPCQTWPNRFFTHAGTCWGITDNNKFFENGQEPFRRPSIFGALEAAAKPWRVYFHDFPQSLLLADIWSTAARRFRDFAQFLVDAKAGVLPLYSFIEPKYFANVFTRSPPNDMHPPHDIRYGEQLIATVYNALRAGPGWENTLFIITYDEHGGCYDHVPPPPAVPPDAQAGPAGFRFDAYGVRVPAVIVSPWLAPGSILQPLADGEVHPFDHTSIIKTLRELAGIATPLTARDEAAPSLLPYLTLPVPSNLGPRQVIPQNLKPSRAELRANGAELPNEYLAALGKAAERLSPELRTIARDTSGAAENVAQVGERAVAQVRAFLARL